MSPKLLTILSASLIFILTGCPSTIAPYSQKSYENATAIKAEALALLSKAADEDFDANKAQVESLKLDVEKAYEYANGIPKNEHISQIWALLKNDGRKGSLFEVLNLWRAKHKLGSAFLNGVPDKDGIADKNIPGIKEKIAKEFDQIIGLESEKNQ